ncbi:MAG: hypothetical protein R3286_08320 [Gammaproteobacteria bacterium]|nr:hypothetical protein [Gammaproteobacteria bacterium]
MATTWTHLLDGVAVLWHWQTYLAMLEYLLICLLMPIGAAFLFSRRPDVEAGSGCLMLVMVPVLEVWAMVVFVMTLSPILLGVSSDADWTLPYRALGEHGDQMSALLGGLALLALAMNAIPLLRREWAVHAFVLGSIIVIFSLGLIAPDAGAGTAAHAIDYIPGPLLSLVIVLLALAASLVDELVLAAIQAVLGPPESPVRHLVISPIAALPGFLPVFVYAAWLGGQL